VTGSAGRDLLLLGDNLELLPRFPVQASSRRGDRCLDCFCGSGTLGVVAASLGRRYVLVDASREAVRISAERLKKRGFRPMIVAEAREIAS
jgi:DNA modification methylase